MSKNQIRYSNFEIGWLKFEALFNSIKWSQPPIWNRTI